MTNRPMQLLRRLRLLRHEYGPETGPSKVRLLQVLGRQPLGTAAAVRELHEILCFWRAYPDSPELLTLVDRLLGGFAHRADLQRFRLDLASSGIAGTDMVHAFAPPTARWLATRWPDRLSIEWDALEEPDRLLRVLLLLVLPAECPGLDEAPLSLQLWLDRLRTRPATDAVFLVGGTAGVRATPSARDLLYEELGVSLRLAAGPGVPTRTHARYESSPVSFQTQALRRDRPDLRAEALRPPVAIRAVSRREAERLIDLARGAMVTRERDLDAFKGASRTDVRVADCDNGLQFACLGVVPEGRFLLEAVYGFLTLKNGVPIGYALASALFQSSEVAFNVFETFRGGEAAHVYGRLLATVRALFGSGTITVYPYQLGHGNDEGLQSGAWWFYYKLGFRPRARAVLPIVRREAARARADPAYRTPAETLKQLVRHNVFLALDGRRNDVMGMLRLDRIGLAVTDYVNSRFGADRAAAVRVLADEAAERLGGPKWQRLAPGERLAWLRLSPLVAVLPRVTQWSDEEKNALVAVIRAKGGVRESEFVTLVDKHHKLRSALVALCRTRPGASRRR